MRIASSEYKKAMNKKIRNRAYASVGIGIVNEQAQKNGLVSSEVVEWCDSQKIFDSEDSNIVYYATLEENFMKCDGSMRFMPEEYFQERIKGAITKDILGVLKINFNDTYSIKGIMINFGEYYPTEFIIRTDDNEFTYLNDSKNFSTADVLGDCTFVEIEPISMFGGEKRLRIYSIIMGIGLNFGNSEIKDLSISESVSTISEELPSEILELSLFDKDNRFNIDDDNSFVQFLTEMQKVSLSFGIDLDNGNQEWIDYATLYLSEWECHNSILKINAIDRMSTLEDEYSLGNKIYSRTAYEEAESILTNAGLEPDEYVLDEYLKDVVLENPMPIASQRECLQLLANACRCKIYQDFIGRIVIKANFATVIDPDDLSISTNGVASWSHPENILYGSEYVYADMTQNFMKTDGTMYFIPEDQNYLETSYVSEQISDENGDFEINPTITLGLPAAYIYYGMNIEFDGNVPKELIIYTYNNDILQDTVLFDGLEKESILHYELSAFDKMIIEFKKTEPYSRILVNQISFGDLTDYVLTKDLMLEKPHGYMEKKIKNVRVKIYSFSYNEDGEPTEVEDNVYFEKNIGTSGVTKICMNQLVSSAEHAELLAEWMGNYYANNISYDVSYRGEPRISAADIIKMENDYLSNLQVEVTEQKLNFNGAFSGTLGLRRALRVVTYSL